MSNSSPAIGLVGTASHPVLLPPYSDAAKQLRKQTESSHSEPHENWPETDSDPNHNLAPSLARVSKQFKHTGGARLDWVDASWPFATLSANEQGLVISCLDHSYFLKRPSITRLTRHRGKLSVGLRIEHEDACAPKLIVFWPSLLPWNFGFQRLKNQLESLGYKVQG